MSIQKSRNTSIVVIAIIAAVLFSSCKNGGRNSGNYNDTLNLVEIMNSDSNFGEYRILQQTPNSDGNFDPGNPDIFYEYDSEGELALEGMYFAYPNNNDHRLLTKLFIFSMDFNLYGFTIGDAEDNVIDILLARGYKKSESTNDDLWYSQADVIVILRVKDGSVSRISVNIVSSVSTGNDVVY